MTSGNPSSLEHFDTHCNIQILNIFKRSKVGHLNITSIIKNIEQLKIYLKNEPLDVLSINEARLDVNVDDFEVQVCGYDIIRKDPNREGGGVAIYYRSFTNMTAREDLAPENL